MTLALPALLCYASLIPALPPANASCAPLPPLPPAYRANWRFPPPWFARAHRDEPLVAGDAQDRVVRAGPAGGRVDEQVDVLVDQRRRGRLREHDVEVRRPKHGLSRVECQPRQLRLDQVGPVLHHRLEQLVAVARLPPGDQVQPVHALGGLPLLDARVAGQLDLRGARAGQPGGADPVRTQGAEGGRLA